jgi:hypothetical protein
VKLLVHVLQVLFAIGWIGCAVTIPLCAWKYSSVIFEKDTDEDIAEQERQGEQQDPA